MWDLEAQGNRPALALPAGKLVAGAPAVVAGESKFLEHFGNASLGTAPPGEHR